MNKLNLAEVSKFCKSAKIIPSLPFEDGVILDDDPDCPPSFNLSAYLIAKHPDGGEIYSRFSIDFHVCETGIDAHFCTDNFELRAEKLIIENTVSSTVSDDLITHFPVLKPLETRFNPDHLPSEVQINLASQFISMVENYMGHNLSKENVLAKMKMFAR